MNQEISLTQQNGIATLRVNRPAARNALNWAAQEQFAAAVAQVGSDTAVRVLIITGTGDKAFVSGGDLKELSQHPEPEAGARLNRVMRDALVQLTQLPIPVIAAVNGDAFGGGCEILTACDLRLAASHARFCFAQVRNALCTGWGGTERLVNLLGRARALDLLLTARIFNAQEAQGMGLVQQVADEGGLETAVSQLALQLAVAFRLLHLHGRFPTGPFPHPTPPTRPGRHQTAHLCRQPHHARRGKPARNGAVCQPLGRTGSSGGAGGVSGEAQARVWWSVSGKR